MSGDESIVNRDEFTWKDNQIHRRMKTVRITIDANNLAQALGKTCLLSVASFLYCAYWYDVEKCIFVHSSGICLLHPSLLVPIVYCIYKVLTLVLPILK